MDNSRSLLWKTLIPVAIGLGVVIWLFAREFDINAWKKIVWDGHTVVALLVAVICVCGREFGLMWRYRALSDQRLGWWAAFRITLLQEFTSCITPTSAGGSALSMVFMHREGISLGRATTLTLTSLMLDEMFFVVMCPLIMIFIPYSDLFGIPKNAFTYGLRATFWIVYGGIVAVTGMLIAGTLVRPEAVRKAIRGLFSWKRLKRWRKDAFEMADNMVEAGHDLLHRPASWWVQSAGATIFSWMSRFLVVNALFWAFVPGASQLAVFGRQFVVWTVLTVSPTPGGSGLSEWLFTTYYGDMLSGASVALIIAVIWRFLTYFVYLVAGILVVPSWLRQGKRRQEK